MVTELSFPFYTLDRCKISMFERRSVIHRKFLNLWIAIRIVAIDSVLMLGFVHCSWAFLGICRNIVNRQQDTLLLVGLEIRSGCLKSRRFDE